MLNRLIKKKGAPLTWGPGPSSDPGSGATNVSAAIAAAAGTPRGDYPQGAVGGGEPDGGGGCGGGGPDGCGGGGLVRLCVP
jgi:hypothetical protein